MSALHFGLGLFIGLVAVLLIFCLIYGYGMEERIEPSILTEVDT